MKSSLLFIFCVMCLAMTTIGQDTLIEDFSVGIHKVIPPLSIERQTISGAFSIQDIHPQYKPSWIKEFINIEIQTIQDGKTKIARSEDDLLTEDQIKNLIASDINTDIYLKIDYIPNNNLKHNEPKIYDATFRINPDKDAEFVTGEKSMMSYLDRNVITKVQDYRFEQYALAAVKFTVDQSGHIENVSVQESSKDEKIDLMMVNAMCNMPAWKAAEFYDGSKVDQDFILTVGDMKSCIVPTLNIKRY